MNFDDYANENKTQHNLKWPYIPDPPYRMLIIGGSGSGKTKELLNWISDQLYIDQIYFCVKDTYEAKYQFSINKRENTGLQHLNDPKAFIENSNDMQDVKERQILIVFDDMTADMINNKKLNSILTELFITSRKLNISFVFITQSYFKFPKNVRLNSTHFFIMKIPNKREFQQTALNNSSDISTKDFIKIYKKYTAKP